MRMPETDRPQVRGSSSWTRLSETREAGGVPGKGETCPFVRAYFPRLTGGEDYPPLRRRRFTARCRGRHLYQTHPLTSAPARSRLNANAVVAGSLAAPMSVEMKKPASLVAAILLWLIAFAQLARVLFRVEVTAGGLNIPLWISILAFIVLAAVGIWLWRERREHG